MSRPRPVAWLKAHPLTADTLLAVLLAAVQVSGLWFGRDAAVDYRDPDALAVVLTLGSSAPIAWRRRRPFEVFLVVAAASVALTSVGYPDTTGALGVLVAVYTVAAHCERRRSVLAAAITALGVLVVLSTARWEVDPATVISNYVIFGTAWILGDNLRNRRAYVSGLEDRATSLEREREEQARRAVGAERTRIAREMHDIVAHSVSVMVVQAGAARRVLHTRPEQAETALEAVEEVGRQSLAEMRRLLGVLRREDGPSFGLEPQPSIECLDQLLASTRKAGLAVALTVEGVPLPLPPGVDLSAYRIVQEALTNTLKHAGPAAATVVLRYGADEVQVEVADDGRGAAADGNGGGDGKGLMGMRERVAMCGGELSAGHRPGGGFAVRARIPFTGNATHQ